MMFPGVSAAKHIWINKSFGAGYGMLTLITLFNIGDYIGKFVCSFKGSFTYKISCCAILSRWLFFSTFILSAVTKIHNTVLKSDAFACVDMLLFGILNGYGTSSMMVIGPSRTDNVKRKELIGFIDGFSL